MTNFVFVDNASTTLASAASSSATTMTLASSTNFPGSIPAGFVLPMTLNDQATRDIYEIVYVTAISGATLTVVRAQEGTVAQNWGVGDFAFVAITASALSNFSQAIQTQAQAGNYAADSGTANAGVITLSPVPVSLASLVGAPIRVLKVNSANTGPYAITVNSFASTPVVLPNAAGALPPGTLPGLAIFEIVYDGTNFQLQSISGAGRIRLTTNTTFYVATTGNDSTGTGLTIGSPWLTIQHAWNVLQANYDLAGFSATIQVADGTYTANGLVASGPVVGATQNSVIINGHAGSSASVIIAPTSASCFTAFGGASITVQNMTITATGSGAAGLAALSGGTIQVGTGMIFGACNQGQMQAAGTGGIISFGATNYTITGSAAAHYEAQTGGEIGGGGNTVTVTGTPAFSTAFAISTIGGTIGVTGQTFSGSATGARYSATGNGVVSSSGGGATYFPGSSSGTTATGGQYV